MGSSTVVYVSLLDPTAPFPQGSNCSSLGLPSLPSGWTYHCAASSSLTNIDGTGWIPVNFKRFSAGSPLGRLPLDPINTTSTGEYYTYVAGGSWELNAILESQKYRQDSKVSKQNFPGVVAVGSDLNLSPLFNSTGLVGYWKFDEGSGTTAYDSSSYGNTGTMFTSSTQSNLFLASGCKIGSCANFNGLNQNISVPANTGDELYLTNAVTLSAWVYYNGTGLNTPFVISKGWSDSYQLIISSNKANLQIFKSGPSLCGNVLSLTTLQIGTWYYVVGTYDGQNAKIYINGTYESQATCGFPMNPWGPNLKIGSNYYANTDFVNYPAYWQMFKGRLDEVRIYNRALSDAEIKAIYDATK